MKKIFILFILSVFVFFPCLLNPKPAQAVGAAPLIFDDIEANPGDVLQFEFKVLAEPPPRPTKTFYFSTQNFVASSEETGSQEFLETELPPESDLASWIHVIEESVTIEAGGEAAVHVVITVPEDAEPGGHYAVVWTGEQPPGETGGIVGVGGNIGVLFLVRVNGDVIEDARVDEFNYLRKFQNRLPVDFYSRINNLGSVHFKPEGDIVIRGIFGNEVAQVDANPLDANVLPDSIRRISSWWVKEPGLEDTGFFSAVKNEWKNFAFGPYKAELKMVYGKENKGLNAETGYFWVIPWHLIIVAIVGLIVLIMLLKLYNRFIIRRAVRNK